MSAVGAGGVAPKGLVDSLVLRETENRTISYLTVTDDMAGEAKPATPEALQAYYKDNSAQFMAPEYRVFSAIILKNSDLSKSRLCRKKTCARRMTRTSPNTKPRN